MKGPEQLQIGSPSKNKMGNIVNELDDGPNMVREKRMRTPVRAPPTKRRSTVHTDEPATKKIITGDMSDDDMNDLHMTDLGLNEAVALCRKHSKMRLAKANF